LNKPIFILGCSKSGTSLLRNLLDGHPDLFVIPTEAHFFQNTKYWVNYAFRSTKPEPLSFDEKKERLIRWIAKVNEVEDSVSDSFSKNRWDVYRVKKILKETKVSSDQELMDIYIKALYSGLYGTEFPENLRFVEKSVENAEFASELLKFYPEAKFLHIIRNPYSNLVALRKYSQHVRKTSKFPYLKNILFSLYNSFYFLYKNSRLIHSYKVVRYEDILTNPEQTMREVAEFLEISFQDSLLMPTMFSEKWQGNSTSQVKFDSISKTNVDRWKKEITPLEVWIVNHFFNFVIRDYDYEHIPTERGLYWPQKKETLKTYIQNRIFLKMFLNF